MKQRPNAHKHKNNIIANDTTIPGFGSCQLCGKVGDKYGEWYGG